MKTGVFRYSPSQVELFDLPGEIVENPLVYWKKLYIQKTGIVFISQTLK